MSDSARPRRRQHTRLHCPGILQCIIIKDLIYIIPDRSSGFPYLLQFKSKFGNMEFMIWATVSSRSWFCWLYRASPPLTTKNIINLILMLTIWWYLWVESSLVLLEEDVCHDQCILLAKFCYLLPYFILYSKAKFACYSRCFSTSYFCIPVPYNEKDFLRHSP